MSKLLALTCFRNKEGWGQLSPRPHYPSMPRYPKGVRLLQADSEAESKAVFSVIGMTCAACAGFIENAINRLSDIHEAFIDVLNNHARVLFYPSLVNRCSISAIGTSLDLGIHGFITAQGRTNQDDGNGFVFKNCNVFGNGKTYLGRPWRGYAKVLFYNTSMSNIILPSGWDPWKFVGHEDRITFAEYGNFGPSSNTSMRVSWTKKLDLATINKMTSISFIDTEGWLKEQQF